MKLGKLF